MSRPVPVHLRSRRRGAAALAVATVAFLLAGCASSGSGGSAGKSLGTASVASSGCGSLPGSPPPDPDGALAKLPASAQSAYTGDPDPVQASAWAQSKPVKGPWKIGVSAIPVTGPTGQAYLTELQTLFTQAKAKGLVTGSLQEQIMPDPNAPTAAQQIQQYQTLVRSGVNAVIVQPFSPPSLVTPVDQAGRAGVVTVSLSPIASSYDISTQSSFYSAAGLTAAAVLHQLKGKGNVLIVRGIAGVAPDSEGYRAYQAALKLCPGIKVVGQVTAQFSDSSAKSAVQTFLAAHPGKIDAVLQVFGMSTGVLNAFQSAGRPVPLITGNGATAGYYSYWAKHLSTFSTAGIVNNPQELMSSVWDTMMRTLAGNGPKVTVIDTKSPLITNANVQKFVVAGQPDTSTALVGPVASLPFVQPGYLDQFFAKPGSPMN